MAVKNKRGERGEENQLFPHEVAENPSVGGEGFLQFRLGHGRMGDDGGGGVNARSGGNLDLPNPEEIVSAAGMRMPG